MTEQNPAQRIWAAVFRRPIEEAPALDPDRVRAIVDSLHDSRERAAVLLHFGLDGPPLVMEEVGMRLPRSGGGLGVTRQMAEQILRGALRHLRHPTRRRAWEEARKQ